MFTNTANQEIAVEAMKAGLADYVLKSAKNYVRLRASARAAIERAGARQRSALLEIRYQSLLEQLSIGVFRAASDRRLVEANRAFLQLFQISSLTDERVDQLTEQLSELTELALGQK